MKKQLKLTTKELEDIGFYEVISKGDEMNVPRRYFKIDILDGSFYFNPKEDVYTWYYKSVIGNVSFHNHLDIQSKPELLTILSAFRVEFDLTF